MRLVLKLLAFTALAAQCVAAQDLAPRAYVITQLHSNALNLTYSFLDGNIILGNGVPITAPREESTSLLWMVFQLQFFSALRCGELQGTGRRRTEKCLSFRAAGF